jgi:hypothetical protein
VPEDHQITIDGKRWLLRFTRLKGDAAGWTLVLRAIKNARKSAPETA